MSERYSYLCLVLSNICEAHRCGNKPWIWFPLNPTHPDIDTPPCTKVDLWNQQNTADVINVTSKISYKRHCSFCLEYVVFLFHLLIWTKATLTPWTTPHEILMFSTNSHWMSLEADFPFQPSLHVTAALADILTATL